MKQFPLSVIFQGLDRVSAPLKNIRANVSKFQNSLDATGKKFNSAMDKSAKIGLAASAVGDLRDATAGMLAPVIGIGTEFEKTMTKVGALARLDFASNEFKMLEENARKLGATTSFSASQAAEGMTYLAMAGFDANKIVQAMPSMLDLAKAGNIDLARAADIASNTLGAFKMEAKDMPRVSNAMAAAFTRSNVDLEMMAETFKYVAPVANSAGMSIESLASMTGLLGDIGIQGSQAGTALRAGILRLATAPKPAAAALEELGIVTKDSSGNLRQLPDILEEIRIKTAGMGTGTRLEFIKNIFGTEAASAFTELISKADESKKSIKDFADEISKASQSNEVAALAEKMSGSLGEMQNSMNSAKEEFMLTIFDVLKPALKELTIMGTKAFRWVGDFAKENPNLTATIVGVVAAIAGLTSIIAPLLLLAAGLSAGFATLSAMWATFTASAALATSGVWAFTSALLANPITWFVVAIVGFIAVLKLLYDNWEYVLSVFNKVVAYWSNLPGFVKLLIGYFMPFIGIPMLIAEHWDTIKMYFSEFFSYVGGIFSSGYNSILNAISPLWTTITDALKSAWAGVSGFFGSILEGIKSKFNSAVQFVAGIINKISGMIPEWASDFIFGKGVKNWSKDKMGQPLNTGKSVPGGVGTTNKSTWNANVDFSNIPIGTKIKSTKNKNVNMSMGYGGRSF